MSVSDDLRATAEKIRDRGWFQGAYQGPQGEVCILGGMSAALNLDIGDEGAMCESSRHIAMTRVITEHLGIDYAFGDEFVYTWNDEEGRTKEEVLQVLEDAAVKNQPDAATFGKGD